MKETDNKTGAPAAGFLRGVWENAGMALVFAAMFAAAAMFVPYFFTVTNMKGLALSVSMVGMGACTMLFCLACGHFDLSIESIVAFSGVLAVVVANALSGSMSSFSSVALGMGAGVLAGTLVGVMNGVIVAKFGINALITTLATMQIVRGMALITSGGKAVGISDENFYRLGLSDLLGVPTPVLITVACFVIFGFLLNRTTFGRNTLAIGGNEQASRLAGIAVDRTKIAIFAMQGMVAGFAGVVLASRLTSGQPNIAQGFALEVISACVLGGVSLTGGVGTMPGVIVGVLIMGMVQNVMNLLAIEAFWQYVARGAILLSAVLFDRWKQRRFHR
ncbi:MAG TPA: L-arabinose ABC transporter permease AraH [Candidatus Brocadiia bacterium]|nr:L-arabinose ABC transporter permease AraH [Candidatus Brocadiia bacterium]